MDWNWFFSSLAQATAAVTGIFAAFIITKIINLQSEFKRKEAKMKELLVLSENHRDALKDRRWKWYCGVKMDIALTKLDALLESSEIIEPDEALQKIKFPAYIAQEEVVKAIRERIDAYYAAKVPADEEVYTQLVETENDPPPAAAENRDEMRVEKEQIKAAIRKTRRHIRQTRLHLSEIGGERDEARLVQNSIIVAGLLFIFGVALPLSFLRVSNGENDMLDLTGWLMSLLSIKGVLLLVVTAIFLYILMIFWRVSRRLEFSSEDIAVLRNATTLTTYSPYLAVKAENKKRRL